MKAIATCFENIEEVTKKEIKEIINSDSKIILPGRVQYNATKEEIAKVIYYARSIINSYEYKTHFEFKTKEDILNNLPDLDLEGSFVVRCHREGEHNFTSIDIERAIGERIYKNTKLKVDLENADNTVLIDIKNNHCIIGLDYCGRKLSKRDYKIKTHPTTLNPCIAYSALRLCKEPKIILDPFSKDGTIPIETALHFSKTPQAIYIKEKLLFTRFLDLEFKDTKQKTNKTIYCIDPSMPNIKASEINAKLANINKDLKFSKYDLSWLDTKFEKGSINLIISNPPETSKRHKEKDVDKIYKELFYQSNYILNGQLCLILTKKDLILKYAKQYEFKLIREIKTKLKNTEYFILIFEK